MTPPYDGPDPRQIGLARWRWSQDGVVWGICLGVTGVYVFLLTAGAWFLDLLSIFLYSFGSVGWFIFRLRIEHIKLYNPSLIESLLAAPMDLAGFLGLYYCRMFWLCCQPFLALGFSLLAVVVFFLAESEGWYLLPGLIPLTALLLGLATLFVLVYFSLLLTEIDRFVVFREAVSENSAIHVEAIAKSLCTFLVVAAIGLLGLYVGLIILLNLLQDNELLGGSLFAFLIVSLFAVVIRNLLNSLPGRVAVLRQAIAVRSA